MKRQVAFFAALPRALDDDPGLTSHLSRMTRIAALTFVLLASLSGCINVPHSNRILASTGVRSVGMDQAGCTTLWPTVTAGLVRISALNPAGFRLMTWNVYKAQAKGWPADFARLNARQDLVLLQEAHLTPRFRSALDESRLHWVMAHAFDYKGAEAGVLTAGKVEPLAACLNRIPEPMIRVPKSYLLTRHPLDGLSEELWVANLHGVNFTLGTEQFRHQLESLADLLAPHRGPMILAGDFNNWSERRSDVLDSITRRLRLTPLQLAEDNRSRHLGYPVDLVFYRGVEVVEATSVEVLSSDHNPVLVRFRIPGPFREGNQR